MDEPEIFEQMMLGAEYLARRAVSSSERSMHLIMAGRYYLLAREAGRSPSAATHH